MMASINRPIAGLLLREINEILGLVPDFEQGS